MSKHTSYALLFLVFVDVDVISGLSEAYLNEAGLSRSSSETWVCLLATV